MGGFMFIIGMIVAVAVCVPLYFHVSGQNPQCDADAAKDQRRSADGLRLRFHRLS